MASPIVTITTDFGTRDSYVGQMKGVILTHCPESQLIDITHEVAPQNISFGAQLLTEFIERYPPASVHLVVIDPGVGTSRSIVAVEWKQRFIVCPNNGLLSELVTIEEPKQIVHVNGSPYPETVAPTYTFHGRDIMAPLAAAIASGKSLSDLGKSLPIESVLRLPKKTPTIDHKSGLIDCQILHVDHFGNTILRLRQSELQLPIGRRLHCETNGDALSPTLHVVNAYAEAKPGEAVFLVGSQGYWEISIVNGNAADTFGFEQDASLKLQIQPA